MNSLPRREVTLVLCSPDGRLLGALPPYVVPSPWWQDVSEVISGARTAYGLDVTVLRLLTAQTRAPEQGGRVAYLAQVANPADTGCLAG